MPAFIDLSGFTFGRLTVVSRAPNNGTDVTWNCLCACGRVSVVRTADLRRGDTKSCGCLKVDVVIARCTSHGLTGTRTYRIWNAMRTRCNNASQPSWKRYGGAGIRVCDEWRTFERFLSDMGKCPSDKHSIDRLDPSGHYTKNNCRWATWDEQMQTRRQQHPSIRSIASALGINASTVYGRIRRGWGVDDALTAQKCQGKRTYHRSRHLGSGPHSTK